MKGNTDSVAKCYFKINIFLHFKIYIFQGGGIIPTGVTEIEKTYNHTVE